MGSIIWEGWPGHIHVHKAQLYASTLSAHKDLVTRKYWHCLVYKILSIQTTARFALINEQETTICLQVEFSMNSCKQKGL
jgi:hypothetical protein